MTDAEILTALTQIFRSVFDEDAITLAPDTTADDIPGWDSQANITLVVATEQSFDVRFRTSEIDSLRNVGEFVRLISMKKNEAFEGRVS